MFNTLISIPEQNKDIQSFQCIKFQGMNNKILFLVF